MSADIANSIACAIVGAIGSTIVTISWTEYRTLTLRASACSEYSESSRHRLTGNQKREHITPVRHKLHWLPISAIIKYKIASMMSQSCLPEYLSVCIPPATYSRHLRFARNRPSLCSGYQISTIQHRQPHVAAPKIWNTITANLRTLAMTSALRTFAKHLKWHIILEAFNVWSWDYNAHTIRLQKSRHMPRRL